MSIKLRIFKDGTIVVLVIALVGLILQSSIGPISWELMDSPINVAILLSYICLLFASYLLRHRVCTISWAMTYNAAVPSIFITGIATIIFGITCDRSTLTYWPFVLLYFWLTTILGLLSFKYLHTLFIPSITNGRRVQVFGALLNHLGLFIVIVIATLGSADMQRLHITCLQRVPEWRAIDETKRIHQLDYGIQLNRFILEEYPTEIASYPGEPKRFASDITIYTKSDSNPINAIVEVNKPYALNGWMIYQYGYDEMQGKESRISIFELVFDPWLPYVYVGIYMLITGVLVLLLTTLLKAIHRKDNKWIYPLYTLLVAVFILLNILWPFMHTRPVVPALQSRWFAPHVTVYMLCYTLMGLATIIAIVLLLSHLYFAFNKSSSNNIIYFTFAQRVKGCFTFVQRAKGSHTLDELKVQKNFAQTLPSRIDDLVLCGLSLMTIGMLFGALWAKEAWGHYWTWDPKETWAAATWILYLSYIHLRLFKPLMHKTSLCLLIVAFLSLQMCWWGINYLPTARNNSVHTYNVDR